MLYITAHAHSISGVQYIRAVQWQRQLIESSRGDGLTTTCGDDALNVPINLVGRIGYTFPHLCLSAVRPSHLIIHTCSLHVTHRWQAPANAFFTSTYMYYIHSVERLLEVLRSRCASRQTMKRILIEQLVHKKECMSTTNGVFFSFFQYNAIESHGDSIWTLEIWYKRSKVTVSHRVRVAYGDVSSEEDNEITSTVRSQRSHHSSALLARC